MAQTIQAREFQVPVVLGGWGSKEKVLLLPPCLSFGAFFLSGALE